MIDARDDLAGAINEQLAMLERIDARIDALYESASLTVAEIAERQHVKVPTLCQQPWRLPGFGVPDFGRSPKRFRLTRYCKWMDRPEAERRSEWETMAESERNRIRELAA